MSTCNRQTNEIYFGWCANGKSEFKKLTTQIQTKNTTNVNSKKKRHNEKLNVKFD